MESTCGGHCSLQKQFLFPQAAQTTNSPLWVLWSLGLNIKLELYNAICGDFEAILEGLHGNKEINFGFY